MQIPAYMFYFLKKYLVCFRERRRPKPRHRQARYIFDVASRFRLDEFKTFFRVSRASVQSLHNWIVQVCVQENIAGIIDRTGTGGVPQIPLNQRLLVLLWYFASLDKYSSIAGIAESTACSIIHNLVIFMEEHLLNKVIVWPTAAEMAETARLYQELKQFDGVVGMIDGTHIPIRKPAIRGIDYYNRKDYYSVILQAVVSHDLRFIDVYTGWPGKVHDARVFQNSPLFQSGPGKCGNYHILGDSAYPNISWLLTPFQDNGHLTETQKKYNVAHSGIRSAVERAFGILKGRCTRLKFIDQRKDMRITIATILSACSLHNICIMNNDEFVEVLQEDDPPQHLDLPNIQNFAEDIREAGARKRLAIARGLAGN